MITLLSGHYTKKDFETLSTLIDESIDKLMDACSQGDMPPGLVCENCDHKYLCDDLLRFQRYLYKITSGV